MSHEASSTNEPSSDQPSVEEPDWPDKCEHCGHELVSTEVAVMPGGDEQMNVPVVQDVCRNPDCPASDVSRGE